VAVAAATAPAAPATAQVSRVAGGSAMPARYEGAPPTVARAAQRGVLKGVVIALDPGHHPGNASHPGKVSRQVWAGTRWKPCNTVGTSTNKGYAEARFTRSVARRLERKLEKRGAIVRLTTRGRDWGPCINRRGRFGATIGAELTVSIHADGQAAGLRGFHVIRPGSLEGYTRDIDRRSKRLGRALRTGLLRGGFARANYLGGDGMDVRTDLGTLNFSDVPVVMVEAGNMRNRRDARWITRAKGRDRLAAALLAGIRRYLRR